MIRALVLVACALLAQLALAGNPAPKAAPDETLLRELELRYSQCMDAARRGDLAAYWQLRTEASRNRPPALDAERLRLLADLLPPLSTLEFVRLDTSPKAARALYRWRKADVAQYSVVVYRMERGEWKLDDLSVRRTASGRAVPGTPPPPAARPPAAPSDQSALAREAVPAENQAMLRAWERSRPDPSLRLDAPRL
jgi:hypothetical protein